MDKIRPNASVKFSHGNDGRDSYFYISYSCPNCNKMIEEKDIACTECGVFFDWKKKAKICVERKIVWE